MKKGGASEGAGPPLDFHNAAAHPSPGLQRWAASFVLYGVGSAGGHFSKIVRSGAPLYNRVGVVKRHVDW